jgi:hypothetical protein
MKDMKRTLLLALSLWALPLLAQSPAPRVAARCEQATSYVLLSGRSNGIDGREFAVRINNTSNHPIALPRNIEFGWAVDLQDSKNKKKWEPKAAGGPAHRVSLHDTHLVSGPAPANTPLDELAPDHSKEYRIYLPEAEKALQVSANGVSVIKLTLYWAASAELLQSNHQVLACGVAPEWIATVQRP